VFSSDPVQYIKDSKVFLAPLSGISNIPFRLMARKFGCRFCFTEMIDVNGVFFDNKKTLEMLDHPSEDSPLGVQIVGQGKEKVLRALDVCGEKGYKIIDVNCGCPARKVIKAGKGASLLNDFKKLEELIGAVCSNTSAVVTVKLRAIEGDGGEKLLEIVDMLSSKGVKAVTIHSRTAREMYKGKPDHSITAYVKKKTRIAVFASGNIFDAESAQNVFKETGCDAVAVARGSFGKPWIFDEINSLVFEKERSFEESFESVRKVLMQHMELAFRYLDPTRVSSKMYKNVTWYLKRYKNLNEMLRVYVKLKTETEISEFLELAGRWQEYVYKIKWGLI